jgi:hypothetical protein
MRGTEQSKRFQKAIVRPGSKKLSKPGFRYFRLPHESMRSDQEISTSQGSNARLHL